MSDKAKKRRRKWLGGMAKAAPIVTGVGGAIIGHQYGALAGGAFTGASAFGAKYAAEAGARGAGKRGSAGKWGKQAMQRTLIGGGIGTVAGAGVAALQTYGKTGHSNEAFGTFLGGQQNLLGISSMTKSGLDSALPALQKSFGFNSRTLRKDKEKEGGYGVILDKWRDKLPDILKDKLPKDEPENGGQGGMGGGMFGGMMRQVDDESPTGSGNGGAIAAAIGIGLLMFAG